MASWKDKVLTFAYRHLRRTNTFQIILVSVTIHSLISILVIYLHLGWFFEYQIGNYQPKDLSSKEGGIEFARRRYQLNLVSDDDVDSTSHLGNQPSMRGWWSDHAKWSQDVVCFPQKWLLCSKVLSTKCRPDSVRSIYQFIPIRRDALVESIEIALRSRTDGGLQYDQDSNRGFGLLALIQTTGGSDTQVVRLEFPSNIDDWTRRTVVYSAPAGTRITEITIMLYCHGFSGLVSLADVEVIPSPDRSDWTSASSIISSCPHDVDIIRDDPGHFDKLLKHLDVPVDDAPLPSQMNVTLAVHLSLDRLPNLERSLSTWKGPVSIAVYAAVKTMDDSFLEWQRMYVEKKVKSLTLPKGSHVQLLVGREDEVKEYPINTLRNVAIAISATPYVFLIDADFQPSPDVEKDFLTAVEEVKRTKMANLKVGFIVPAFEYLDSPQTNDISTTKDQLIRSILSEDPNIQPFQSVEAPESHRLTNYWKWYFASKPYRIRGYSDKFEPYFIVEKAGLPPFDETFTGYGMNKVTHTIELFASGYTFFILPNSWLVHFPHPSSSFSQDFLTNPLTRLRNRRRRFHFLLFLRRKYPHLISRDDCPPYR